MVDPHLDRWFGLKPQEEEPATGCAVVGRIDTLVAHDAAPILVSQSTHVAVLLVGRSPEALEVLQVGASSELARRDAVPAFGRVEWLVVEVDGYPISCSTSGGAITSNAPSGTISMLQLWP